MEDYLEAIAELIAVDGHAHSKEIAERLSVKMPSVTGALRQLDSMGYIVYNTHYPVQLTSKGKEIADLVIHRHRVLKKFFAEILGLTAAKASETACHLEHVVDEDTIQRFVLFSEAIENRSDARSLQTYLTEAIGKLSPDQAGKLCVLSELSIGESAVVESFSRNLNSSENLVLSIGDKIEVAGVSLDKTILHVSCCQRETDIPVAVAENIWVKRS